MAMTTADLKALTARYRLQSEAIGVAALAVVVSLTLGTMARRQIAPLAVERDRLRAATQEVTSFQSAFKPATAEEDALKLPDSLNVTVARDVRFTLAQLVALRAEQNGMRDVRVRFASADTAGAPAAPDLSAGRVAIADYTIAVDCRGSLPSVLAFVRRLPPSVALLRMTAVRNQGGVTDFHLTLAVFEASGQNAHG